MRAQDRGADRRDRRARARGGPAGCCSRASAERKFAGLAPPRARRLDYDAAVAHGDPRRAAGAAAPAERVAIVCGGTSDVPVAREAARTLAFEGEEATLVVDVGVAGLWRLMERIDEIRRHRVVIAVAGMEGALFSVLAGLVPCAVIAVPTLGRLRRGRAAAARRCTRRWRAAPRGSVVVNIDNGFGAAHAALRMLGAPVSPPA